MHASLRALGAGPAFLIRTKHHAPPTYYGANFERLGRSSVFAFSTRGFATRVAQGLEAHRRVTGHFPEITAESLELGDDTELHALDMLEIEELSAARLSSLVEGSGVVLCYVRMDGAADTTSDTVHAQIVYDKKITRTWLHDVWSKSA